jgi:DNA-binding MarR family transcriptional regulator
VDAPARLRRLPTWLLSQAAIQGDRRVNEALGKEGARKYHYRVLVALSEGGPLSQAELGRRLHIDRSDMVTVVTDLEQAGYVERERDAHDRRRNVVALTQAGEAALDRMDAAVKRAQADLLAPLSAAERRELARLLDRLVSDADRPRR